MIKAEWTNADALDLQPTCNKLATDCISRQGILNWLETEWDGMVVSVFDGVRNMPSAQPEIKPVDIDYYYCSNAMLKMWIDNVLTDGQYNRIMDKLNDFERKRRENENG